MIDCRLAAHVGFSLRTTSALSPLQIPALRLRAAGAAGLLSLGSKFWNRSERTVAYRRLAERKSGQRREQNRGAISYRPTERQGCNLVLLA